MSESTSQNPPMTRRQARAIERAAAFQRPQREQVSEQQVQLPPRPRGAESGKRAEAAPTVAFARPAAGEQPRLRPDRSATASRVAAAVASGTRPARAASAGKAPGGGRAADAREAEVINLNQARAAATLRSGRPGGPAGRRRRRVVAGAAIAASAAVLASTGALAVMQGGSGQRDSGAPASADLLSGAEETPKPSNSVTPQAASPSVTPSTGAEQAPAPAQPEPSAPSAQPASDPGEGASGQAGQVPAAPAAPVASAPQSVGDAPAYLVSTVSPEEVAQASEPAAEGEQAPVEAAPQSAPEPQKPEPVLEEPASVSPEPVAEEPAPEPASPAPVETAPVAEEPAEPEPAAPAPAEPAPEPVVEEPAPVEPADVSADDSADAAAQPAGAQAPGQAAGGSVVETAQQYVGQVPYVLGGASPDAGFDCSGLVQYVYAQHGVSLPHSVSGQAAAGTVVDDPQPGDLVIFGNYHVGIYMGDGMMIDAPDTGRMVEIGDLDAGSDYYFVRI